MWGALARRLSWDKPGATVTTASLPTLTTASLSLSLHPYRASVVDKPVEYSNHVTTIKMRSNKMSISHISYISVNLRFRVYNILLGSTRIVSIGNRNTKYPSQLHSSLRAENKFKRTEILSWWYLSTGTIDKEKLFSILLTHWGRVTHVCVGKLMSIGSDNGLSPRRRQAIIWTNAAILLIGTLGKQFSEILIEMQTFSLKKIRLKMSSAKHRPFCLGIDVLNLQTNLSVLFHPVGRLYTMGSLIFWFRPGGLQKRHVHYTVNSLI